MSDKKTLAFEVGVEEMPARFVPGAMEALAAGAEEMLKRLRLDRYDRLEVLSTPRRLIWMVYGLPAVQEEGETWVRGPSRQAAFDADGKPTQAALGFARSQGIEPEDLEVRDTDQGTYVFARKVEAGRPAGEVLAEPLAELVLGLPFPRPMRWGHGEIRFIRPIRWLVALLDEEVLPVVIGNVTAGNQTRGHRTLNPGPHTVKTAADLPGLLRDIGLEPDVEARRQKIVEQAEKVAASLGGKAVIYDDLLTEVTHLVETPTAFYGSFDPAHLDLPAELLITVMKVHQRYFPVAKEGAEDGEAPELLPHFIGVCNGDDRNLDTVRRGNERVIAARLADARFFYKQDQNRPLADYVPELARISFRERLGTMLDKTHRLERLVAELCDYLGVEGAGKERALRAATLTRADLRTQVVYEFSELEGVMGRHYARLSGEPEEVAQALYEQYLPPPGSRGDDPADLPATMAGTLLAVADRADTLAGSFAIGLEPTGSEDPFGLRRQAAGLLIVLAKRGISVPLRELFEKALAGYGRIEGAGDPAATMDRLLEFCRVRLEGQMRDAGLRPDVIDAVLARDWTDIPDVWERARAVTRLLETDHLDDVVTVYRRSHNLARQADDRPVDRSLLQEAAEVALHDSLLTVGPEAEAARAGGDYDQFFRTVARLREEVDAFLDGVLVMAPEADVRANRLALLRSIEGLLGPVADLSRLAV
ncbi:MAG TPA: glycine--tRNA ligase subunit beta [Sphingobacteriaceae bacterium]|nr:glycine--tRNA ligase subunit beta [Sphingobacteriaceae bacterium]